MQQRGDRTPKELYWVGDGMQIFVQILTHLWRLRSADVVILDEPDLYLHADLQRRLVRLLDSTPAQTITATHSSEMLAEASSDSVVWVDKSRRRAVRRPKPASLEDLSTQIGSSFNLAARNGPPCPNRGLCGRGRHVHHPGVGEDRRC